MNEHQYRWAQKYIELADTTVGRREELNKMFLVANTGLLAIESYFSFSDKDSYSALCLSSLGIGLCLIWMFISNYYRNLMNAKGKVIRDLEKQYNLAPYPWTQQVTNKGPSPFHSLSVMEIAMPFPFFMLNMVVIYYHWEAQLPNKVVLYVAMVLAIAYLVFFFTFFIRNFFKKALEHFRKRRVRVQAN